MLRDRMLTAAIGIPIFVAGIVIGGIPFAVLIALVAIVMSVELAGVLSFKGVVIPGWAAAISAAGFCILPVVPREMLASALPGFDDPMRVIIIGLSVSLAAALAAALSHEGDADAQSDQAGGPSSSPGDDGDSSESEAPKNARARVFSSVLFVSLYVGFFLSLLVSMRVADSGLALVLAVILSVWANDTAAYFVGKRFGRTKLAPRVSPNKTVEGAAAGLLAGTLIATAVMLIGAPGAQEATRVLLFGLLVAMTAQLGDLFESGIKRSAGVKDSGSILPGHGGLLDRFDSLLFAGAAGYYLSLLL